MRKIILYLGMSLDGYIADPSGGVAWMEGPNDNLASGSYPEFIQTVDTVLMGYTTYRQIAAELSPAVWPYSGMETYVLTHRALDNQPEITFTSEPVGVLAGRLREQEGKHIWLCGGADLAVQCAAQNLIDRYHITVLPILLGGGVRLFGGDFATLPLKLVDARVYGEMTDLIYERAESRTTQ